MNIKIGGEVVNSNINTESGVTQTLVTTTVCSCTADKAKKPEDFCDLAEEVDDIELENAKSIITVTSDVCGANICVGSKDSKQTIIYKK